MASCLKKVVTCEVWHNFVQYNIESQAKIKEQINMDDKRGKSSIRQRSERAIWPNLKVRDRVLKIGGPDEPN